MPWLKYQTSEYNGLRVGERGVFLDELNELNRIHHYVVQGEIIPIVCECAVDWSERQAISKITMFDLHKKSASLVGIMRK